MHCSGRGVPLVCATVQLMGERCGTVVGKLAVRRGRPLIALFETRRQDDESRNSSRHFCFATICACTTSCLDDSVAAQLGSNPDLRRAHRTLPMTCPRCNNLTVRGLLLDREVEIQAARCINAVGWAASLSWIVTTPCQSRRSRWKSPCRSGVDPSSLGDLQSRTND
jgi:hypothetical protein